MRRRLVLGVAILWLLTGCSGNRSYVPDQSTQLQTSPQVQVAADLEEERLEPLAEDLTDQQLEEIYAKHPIPGLEEELEQELKKWGLQAKFNIPIHKNKQVRNYIAYFCTRRKATIRRYLARSTRYLPMIKSVFADYGLPDDLAYLAMIESGFNNRAYSHAHACGMWQFIRSTGRRYGLAINSYVDERRDPEKATRAAARYLLDLYKRFGSWYLAAASYNCGEGRVQKEINRNGQCKNFWDLSSEHCLPGETKKYVPQLIAATIIAKNPKRYGFKHIPYLPPLKYSIVKVKEPTSLKAAAIAVGADYEELKALNPELRQGISPPHYSAYLLKVPYGKKQAFVRNIAMARVQAPAYRRWAKRPVKRRHYLRKRHRGHYKLCYRVRRGDTISKIARRYRTNTRQLMAVNGLRRGRNLKRGQILMVPAKYSRSRAAKRSRSVRKKRAYVKRRRHHSKKYYAHKKARSHSRNRRQIAKRRRHRKTKAILASLFPTHLKNRTTRRSKAHSKAKARYTRKKTSKRQATARSRTKRKTSSNLARKTANRTKFSRNRKASPVRVARKKRRAAKAREVRIARR